MNAKIKYSENFVRFVCDLYVTMRQYGLTAANSTLARYFDIPQSTLKKWVRKFCMVRSDTFKSLRKSRKYQLHQLLRPFVPLVRVAVQDLPSHTVSTENFRPRMASSTAGSRQVSEALRIRPGLAPFVQPLGFVSNVTPPVNVLPVRVPLKFELAVHVRTSSHSVVRRWTWPMRLASSSFTLAMYAIKLFLHKDMYDVEHAVVSAICTSGLQKHFVQPIGTIEFEHDERVCPAIVYPWVTSIRRQEITTAMLENPKVFWEVSLSLLQGLTALHQAGFVHCDIKPDNILVVRDGSLFTVRIIDFSCAHRVNWSGGYFGRYFWLSRSRGDCTAHLPA